MAYIDKPPIDELLHYGVAKRSGRYPWGSGDSPYQHSGDFLSRVETLTKQGKTEKEIANILGMSTTDLRSQKKLAKRERYLTNQESVRTLHEDGHNTYDISRRTGIPESTVRELLKTKAPSKNMEEIKTTSDYLKSKIEEKGMLDVGAGVERELGISKERLKQALDMLEAEGYPVYGGRLEQVTNPGRHTTVKVIGPKGTEHKDIFEWDEVHSVRDYTLDEIETGETSKLGFKYPSSLNPKRVSIRYAEDGGVEKDGVIELRRGVDDISLGKSQYSQVRILVGKDRYLKGMAVYADDLPDGVDVRFNTNKKTDTPFRDVLKKISSDPDNPFGSLIKEDGGQSEYIDKNGKKKLSVINKRADEGDWGSWRDKLPSQFLSKQNRELMTKQLKMAEADKLAEFEEICSYTNPTIKKALLKSFADDCDASAVHLKAAALPRQKYQVILPVSSLSDKEVYAPNFKAGETVALIRFPHGGTFEIPILTVNNKNREAIRMMGTSPKDAIGINSRVAERLSGADFDGDTVMVVPCNSAKSRVRITSTPLLTDLKGFDPKAKYGKQEVKIDKNGKERYYRDGKEYKVMKNTQTEMGKISNLITDMTLKGAKNKELARAVKHSMVVIDAEKHKLDYKKSYEDNDIGSLKVKYQKHIEDNKSGGASTLISRAGAEIKVPKRQGSPKIDPVTGKQSWKLSEKDSYIDGKTGQKKYRKQSSTRMMETDDARTLSSGTVQEETYARYANRMKALANQARKEMISTKEKDLNRTAMVTYKKETASLDAQLRLAVLNKPKEREAQRRATAVVQAKTQANKDMTKAEVKKAKQQALTKARTEVGARRKPIKITPKEWEAIQAGAISKTKLSDIINCMDDSDLKELAMPRQKKAMSTAQINKINSMKASGYSTSDIAEALGVSTSTINKYSN